MWLRFWPKSQFQMVTERQFAYLRDPMFLCCLVIYGANRFLVKPWIPNWFSRDYLNDLICIPFCIPVMLLLMRRMKLRGHDLPPQAEEVLVALFVWAASFELLLPNIPFFRHRTTADPKDILSYLIGAMAASVFWHFWYSRKSE